MSEKLNVVLKRRICENGMEIVYVRKEVKCSTKKENM